MAAQRDVTTDVVMAFPMVALTAASKDATRAARWADSTVGQMVE